MHPPTPTSKTSCFLRTVACTLALLLAAVAHLPAASSLFPLDEGSEDKTLSPTFEVISATSSNGTTSPAETNAEAFPLKSTLVRGTISGVIADVTVEQTYTNTGATPIEARYVFPASTRAAVHGVEMRIGQRVIKAQIQEKAQAKATFEKAKSENKTASLLEQKRPNVFQMSVANILPGDEVRVTLHYSEKLAPTERVYEFVYPAVVGPRYTARGDTPEPWAQNPYLSKGTSSPTTFAIEMNVHAGMPLQSLVSPSHKAKIDFTGKEQATVALAPAMDTGDRDFVLRYQLAEQKVASGLLLHQGQDENFFLLNVQPPARVKADQIPPRDYLFILDVSGSMNGFPLDVSKVLMRDLLTGLKPTDTFNVLTFAGASQTLSPTPLPATPGNIQRGLASVDSMRGGGGTELLSALRSALAMPEAAGASRSMVVVTDGFINIEKEAFNLVRENLNHANLFTFGIGSSVNRWLIEGLAHAGQGEPFIILGPEEAAKTAARFREYISAPVLTDIEVVYEGFNAIDVQPTSLPDVFADRPIELIGKWEGFTSGRIIVKGRTGGAPYETTFDVAAESAAGTTNPALRPLWAREKVRTLSEMQGQGIRGYDGESPATASSAVREVTALGIKYELLTEHTSFVGVDETPREVLAQLQTVNQPLPLPQGVGNSALGGSSSQGAVVTASSSSSSHSVPEPGTVSLLIITAGALMLYRQRKLRKAARQEGAW